MGVYNFLSRQFCCRALFLLKVENYLKLAVRNTICFFLVWKDTLWSFPTILVLTHISSIRLPVCHSLYRFLMVWEKYLRRTCFFERKTLFWIIYCLTFCHFEFGTICGTAAEAIIVLACVYINHRSVSDYVNDKLYFSYYG